MHSTRKLIWAFVLFLPLLSGTTLSAKLLNIPQNDPRNIETSDDYVPDVTDRVARISFIRGDVRVRRADTQEWEKAVLNLPLVAGDEIATDANGRCEIQFDIYTHVRLAENSVLRVTTLKYGGIAVSVPQGSAAARLTNFDRDQGFFEIDAPQTTIAVEHAGMYRIDAGQPGGTEVRITVTDDAQARIYSDNSGFSLRSGRSATLAIAGNFAGEWQTADASVFRDEFDSWTKERDTATAKRLRDAYYDKYYDRDIYGAEDLNDNGEWVHTRDYGYVWRPNSSAIGGYADWSPYRYGAWRWVAPYGWTWVGDEPWGWATYHYGRWVWANGYWVWSPYGLYRYQRSWWEPALVVVSVYNNNVCWYPLPYRRHNRHNYNSHHGGGHGNNQHQNQNGGGHPVASPTPASTPAAQGSYPLMTAEERRRHATMGQMQTFPPTAVVSVPVSEFGRSRGRFHTPSTTVATTILNQSDNADVTPVLPTYRDLRGRLSRDIVAEVPPIITRNDRQIIRTGAADRTADAPLDSELRNRRILGGRAPLTDRGANQPVLAPGTEASEPRPTGAVERVPVRRARTEEPKVTETPRSDTPSVDETRRSVPRRKFETPPYIPPTRETPTEDAPVKVEAPRENPRTRTERPREERPTRRETPSNDSPRNDPPVRTETPRNDPPPRSEPPPRNDPPPTKSEPPAKSDPPPTKSDDGPAANRKSKDGRR